MSQEYDLVWQNLNLLYQSSVAYQYAQYAINLKYKSLPPEVIHQSKRCLLDALCCAIGAYHSPGFPICEDVVKDIGGVQEATIFGSGQRTTALNATLVNSFLVRFLDYNDSGGGGHNSDSIPAILAIAEREKAHGQDFITSLVISYELGARFSEAAGGVPSLDSRGWTCDIRGGVSLPPALGVLMKLNREQIANAIGICASHSLPLGILDSNQEENTMSKNLRFGFIAYNAILSCLLAKKGFTGPIRVVEGENGIREVITQHDMDLTAMTDFNGWRILDVRHKYLCANGSSHGHILATLAIVEEQDLKPDDIAKVRIIASPRESRHTTALPKKYPRNAESADHSAFYANAIAIKERHFGPASSCPEKFTDPVVLDLIEIISVEADVTMPEYGSMGISEITTKDGRCFRKRIDVPHGYGNDPLTDLEIEEKFRQVAIKYMPEEHIQQIFNTIWNLENLEDMSRLISLIVFKEPR